MTQRNTFANNLGNEIRIGQKKSADYIRIAEKVLLNNEEIILSGLGNTITTVVSCAEILKNRKYAHVKKIETSMMEGPDSRKSRIQITLVREPGIKEKLERLSKEREDGSAELEKPFEEDND